MGPGIGDFFFFYRNVEVAWAATLGTFHDEDHVLFTVIGHPELDYRRAEELMSDYNLMRSPESLDGRLSVGPKSWLRPHTIANLLRLNPFIHYDAVRDRFKVAKKPRLDDNARFVKLAKDAITTGDITTASVVREVQRSDVEKTENSRITTRDFNPGFLSTLGYGVRENKTVATIIRQSVSKGQNNVRAVETTFHSAPGGERARIVPYFDRMFGTFAFVRTKPIGEFVLIRR